MVNQGGFNLGENAPVAKDSSGHPQAESLNNPEGQLKNARQPVDTAQVTDSVTAKFRAEAGLTSFESGNLNPRDFRESIRNASGTATVETRQTTFKTPGGDITGFEHSGRDSAGRDQRMFTSNSGETFRVERGENGQTTLRSENSGARTEALRSVSDMKPINRSAAEVGPARVHRAGEPVDVSASEYTRRIQQVRSGVETHVQTRGEPVTRGEVRDPARGNNLPLEPGRRNAGPEIPATPGGERAFQGNRAHIEPTVREGTPRVERVKGEVRTETPADRGRPEQADLAARLTRGRGEIPPARGNRLDLPPSREGRPEPAADRVEPSSRRGNRVERPADRSEAGPRAAEHREVRPFNQNDFRQRLKQLEADPGNGEARRDLTRMMREQPRESTALVRSMQERGESVPRQVERLARMTEGRNGSELRGREGDSTGKSVKHGDSIQSNLTRQELKSMAGQTEALQELLKNPETRKMMQKLLADGQSGDASNLGKNQGAKANLDILSKQLGLDANNPNTQKFFQELGNRLNNLKPGELQSGNVKLQDVLKGLDPGGAKALENYLTHGIGKTGDLRLAQLDPARLTSLRTLLDVQTGKPGANADLAQVLKTLQGRTLNLEQPTAKAFGQNLQELGQQLKLAADSGISGRPQSSLADLIQKSLDLTTGKAGLATTGGELVARLGGPQEQALRTLIENSSKLSHLIETGKINLIRGTDIGGSRLDPGNNLVSDMIARLPQSMRGENFVVRGDILGALAADAGTAMVRANSAAQFSEFITTTTRPDGTQVMVSPIEILSGKPIDPVSGLPYDPFTGKLLDPTTGRVVGSVRPGELANKLDGKSEATTRKELEDRDTELEEEARNKKKALLLLLQARKLREQKEREIREKELREQKRRQEDKKRTRYVVKHGDTLESIAQKQLRDIRQAALIYDINKKSIPVSSENGKTVVHLKKGLVIWLPSPFEQREFRSKVASGKIKPGSIGATAAGGKKFATAEEELAAKFGENWSGSDTDSATAGDVTGKILEEAVKKSDERRKNIEKVLGSFEKGAENKTPSGRAKYVVRLGDSLKSVAMKHPLIRDISLWKLVAEVNKISTAVDARGVPKAKLTRGSSIKIPTQEEIAEYREKLGLSRAFDPQASRVTSQDGETSAELHICDNCGRMAGIKTTVCVCGHATKKKKKEKNKNESSAPTLVEVQEAAGTVPEAFGFASKDAVKTQVDENVDAEPPETEDIAEVLEELDAISRLVKTPQDSSKNRPLTYALQLYMDGTWNPIMSYEIGESKTLRHDDYSGERRKSVKIDLPGKAAEELAKNDLTGNWKNYKRKYLRARS